MFLVLYVDDFLVSRPKENMKIMWGRIAEKLKLDEPGEMGLYQGCTHEEGEVTLENGKVIRTMTFNQEGFFSEKTENT